MHFTGECVIAVVYLFNSVFLPKLLPKHTDLVRKVCHSLRNADFPLKPRTCLFITVQFDFLLIVFHLLRLGFMLHTTDATSGLR